MVSGRLSYMCVVLYLDVHMGFFHAAWACPCWVFPHWLDSAQHPIPQGDRAYEFIIIIILGMYSVMSNKLRLVVLIVERGPVSSCYVYPYVPPCE